MTTTDERTADTAELEQVVPGSAAYALATRDGKPFKFSDLTDLLGGDAPVQAVEQAAAPEVLEVTPDLRKALRELPAVFGGVQPTEPRKMEQAEVTRLTDERTLVSKIVTALGKRDKGIDEAMRHHMDALGREAGIDAPVIESGVAQGHLLLATEGQPFSVQVEGYEDAWQQRRVAGRTEISLAVLTDLLVEKKITRAEFLSFTTEVRVLDEDKIRKALRRSPSRTLGILRAITVRKSDSAQLVPPKK